LQEVRSMCRLRRLGIRVPTLYYVDAAAGCIYMERLAGLTLQQLLADSSADDAGASVVSLRSSCASWQPLTLNCRL
jgi:tRNA A-37 threonylcarbamoyl transferase component Bud32